LIFGHCRHVHNATNLDYLVAVPKVEELIGAGCSIVDVHVERADHQTVRLISCLVHDAGLSKVDKHYCAFKKVIIVFVELMLNFNFFYVFHWYIQSVVCLL
jgi:hypothetical protein